MSGQELALIESRLASGAKVAPEDLLRVISHAQQLRATIRRTLEADSCKGATCADSIHAQAWLLLGEFPAIEREAG